MGESVIKINLRKVAARYATRRAEKPKELYDDSAAQGELLRVMEESAPSRERANKVLGVG